MLPGCSNQTLGQRARGQHLRAGVLLAGLALAYAHFMKDVEPGSALRWLFAIPIALASYALFAGLSGVCAFSGLRGERFQDHGREVILDDRNRRQIRRRTLMMVSLSLVIAGLFAVAFVQPV